jgi:hypothetical protein
MDDDICNKRFHPKGDDHDPNAYWFFCREPKGHMGNCDCPAAHELGDEDDAESGESLSVYDAADIWLSNGMDEDYTFGYDERELRRAAGLH